MDKEVEIKHLEFVNKEVKTQINMLKDYVLDKRNEIIDKQSDFRDNRSSIKYKDLKSQIKEINSRILSYDEANAKLTILNENLKSAYFGSICFDEDKFYIGKFGIQNTDGTKVLVNDWRAPISSVFYEFELGEAHYLCPAGLIKGNLSEKMQYKIEDSKLVYMFDTSITIRDEILQQALAASSGTKMKTIVSTIQKKQNEIIRLPFNKSIVVQGVAGSGKTSIALHKIAYLLYAERDKINNTNLMILSPNEIFSNYISDVLPEIGEDNVVNATFLEFAKAYISDFKIITKIEDNYEIVYANHKNEIDKKFNELKFKYDKFYTTILEDYIEQNKAELLGLDPIEISEETVMSTEEINKIIYSVPNTGESLYLLGKKIVEKVYLVASMKTKKLVTLEKLKKQAIEGLSKIKLKAAGLYKKLYGNKEDFIKFVTAEYKKHNLENELSNYNLSEIFDITNSYVSKDILEYQDVAPFMYLKSQIVGITANKNLKYVLIDEAQDYSICQYKILSMLFKGSNITLLGDLNQSILPFNDYTSYDDILSSIKLCKLNASSDKRNLTKTYRSTYEINEFAKKVLTLNENYSQIDRHGEQVKIFRQEKFDAKKIVDRAIELKKSYNTVAIICKNIEETLYLDYLIIVHENKVIMEGQTKEVLNEEKIIKKLGFNMPLITELSSGLKYYGVVNKKYYDIESLVEDLWK